MNQFLTWPIYDHLSVSNTMFFVFKNLWELAVCLICMKYRIIILIIIIISLGEILLSFIANTSRKYALIHARTRLHARTHRRACVHTHTHTAVAVQVWCVGGAQAWQSWLPFSPVPLAFMAGSWVIQINTRAGDPISPRFWMFSAYKKMLGRIETRTRDRIYCQTIRTVRDISRDDRARIATCSLQTLTDRL